ncbi:MAG TPA: EAL domain-containing protein [Trichocoleus sp.]
MAIRNFFKRRDALRIVLVYALISACWILASDQFLQHIIPNPWLLSRLQTVKGWGFVLITSVLLYGLIRRSQHSLLGSYSLLHNIVEGTTDAVFVKDHRGRYVMVNAVSAEILGHSPEFIVGKDDCALLPEATAQQIQATDQRIMTDGKLVSLEETVPAEDGIRTYWSTKYVWRDRTGQVQGLIGISRDMTDYKRLQAERQQLIEELQQQTEDLQALNLITANAVSTLDLDELLRVFLERLVAVTSADTAVILLSQDCGLRVQASQGLAEDQVVFYNSIAGEGFASTVFQTGKPLHIEDVHSDVRFRQSPQVLRLTRSLLGVPLQRLGQRIGVLQLEWQMPHPYQARELHLLEILAERCTLAILNAQLYEQTRQLKEQLQMQIDRMPVGCIIHDQHFCFIDWNAAATDIFNYTKPEVLGRHPYDLIVPASAQVQIDEIFQRVASGDMAAHSFNENRTKDGRLILCQWHNTPLKGPDGEFVGLLSMVQDVTQQKRAEEHLKRLAYFDSLTGLPQRNLFLKRLQDLIEAQPKGGSPFAVLYLDIERFKFIKYSLGHRISEALLVAIARRLELALSPPVMISRMESDEFAVLLEQITDDSEASRWADIIQRELALPFDIDGHTLFINLCIGIALSTNPALNAEDLLQAADMTMHQAKQAKLSLAVFSQSMSHQVMSALELDTALRLAVERQQFQLHYQPIVTLHNQSLEGFEALIRWHHPEWGLVSPAQFIPLAEQTGLILTIGDWVMTEACQQLQQWQQLCDRTLSMSINLSPLQLRQPELLAKIDQKLQIAGIGAQHIKLEVTESAVVESAVRVADLLRTLRDRQISIVVDDFGTGYSSLSYLHQFPFNTVKIDRSFISRIGQDHHSLQIVQTIVDLAHNLNMSVVAEGIETVQQLQLLQHIGCDFGQGYLFSRPVDSTTAEQLIVSGNSWHF